MKDNERKLFSKVNRAWLNVRKQWFTNQHYWTEKYWSMIWQTQMANKWAQDIAQCSCSICCLPFKIFSGGLCLEWNILFFMKCWSLFSCLVAVLRIGEWHKRMTPKNDTRNCYTESNSVRIKTAWAERGMITVWVTS